MKTKDIIMIYEDQITKLKPEGKAMLIKEIGHSHKGMSRWKVKFISDGYVCDRFIDRG